MKILLVQPEIVKDDIYGNLQYYQALFDKIDRQVDWIVLPEDFITGFSCNTSLADLSRQEGLRFLRRCSMKYQCAVEGSLLVKIGSQYHNRHYFINNKEEYFYDKKHLFSLSDEKQTLTRGNKHCIVKFNQFKINLMTCYDLRFGLWSNNKLKNGEFKYDILSYVASWPKERAKQWDSLLRARAIENQSYVVAVNYVQDNISVPLTKEMSGVFSPKGEKLKPLRYSTKNLLYFQINKEDLIKDREKFPISLDWDI